MLILFLIIILELTLQYMSKSIVWAQLVSLIELLILLKTVMKNLDLNNNSVQVLNFDEMHEHNGGAVDTGTSTGGGSVASHSHHYCFGGGFLAGLLTGGAIGFFLGRKRRKHND